MSDNLKTRRKAGSVELAEHFKQSEPSAFGLRPSLTIFKQVRLINCMDL